MVGFSEVDSLIVTEAEMEVHIQWSDIEIILLMTMFITMTS